MNPLADASDASYSPFLKKGRYRGYGINKPNDSIGLDDFTVGVRLALQAGVRM